MPSTLMSAKRVHLTLSVLITKSNKEGGKKLLGVMGVCMARIVLLDTLLRLIKLYTLNMRGFLCVHQAQ